MSSVSVCGLKLGRYSHQAKTNELPFELIVTGASVCAPIFILSYLIRLSDFDVSFSGNPLASIFLAMNHLRCVTCKMGSLSHSKIMKL